MNRPTGPRPETLGDLVAKLFIDSMTAAREAGTVPAEAVQDLISQSRALVLKHGGTDRETNGIFCMVQSMIHWDWHQPTDRIFETLLDFELTQYWKDAGIAGAYDATNIS